MIKLENSTEDFFLCTTANWTAVVKAECENSASKRALEKAIEELKEVAEVSPCIRVKKIEEKIEDSDFLIRIDKVFSDIGMYKESRSINEILNKLSK